MKRRTMIALSALGGVAVGAATVQAIHAQAGPPAYVVAEVDVRDPAPYEREYVPAAGKAITDGGGKYIVRGGQTVGPFWQPPQTPIVIMVFRSIDKAQAPFNFP